MGISMLSKIVFLAAILLAPLNAEETKENPSCDVYYDLCNEKCEQADNPSESCFNTCEKEYNKCFSLIMEDGKKDSE